MDDPIVDEIHRIREELFEQHKNDLDLFFAGLIRRQSQSGHEVVSFPPAPAVCEEP